jgi:hypothetical protein
MTRGRKIDRNKIFALKAAGLTNYDIAERLNTVVGTIQYILREANDSHPEPAALAPNDPGYSDNRPPVAIPPGDPLLQRLRQYHG